MSRPWKRFLEGPVTQLAITNGHVLLLALGRTWKVRFTGREAVDAARLGKRGVLYALSHGVLLPSVYMLRDRSIQALVSESRDGEIISRVSGRLGFEHARGSSSKSGERAVLRLAARAREGYDLIITPDGPRGPRGSVAPGVGMVAARGEVPIVPLGIAASQGWHARSWDRFLIPKPGSRVVMNFQPPISVARRDDIQDVAEQVRVALRKAEDVAAQQVQDWDTLKTFTRIPA